MMQDYIDKLLASCLNLKEVSTKFDAYGDTDDFEIYRHFTAEDLRIRNEFYSYLDECQSLDQLRRRWIDRG